MNFVRREDEKVKKVKPQNERPPELDKLQGKKINKRDGRKSKWDLKI